MVGEVNESPRKSTVPPRGRGRQVASLAVRVGASYGTSVLTQRVGLLDAEGKASLHARNAARVLETAATLRGPFMKVVQLFATQSGLLPEEYIDRLSVLHDQASPLPWEEFRPVLTRELGREPERIFRWVQREPIAAASLGQVYAGMLHDGTLVAIKVQYPGIREAVESDLRAFKRVVKVQRRFAPRASSLTDLNLDEMLADLSDRLREEVDYRREAANVELFRRMYRDCDWVVIPRVRFKLSTDRVLTLDLMTGVSLGDVMRLSESAAERQRLVSRLCQMFDYECYGVGVFHADPHPGNKLIGPEGQVQLLDFGCVKILPRKVRDALRASARALVTENDAANLAALRDLGLYRDGLDPGPALAWARFTNRPLLAGEPAISGDAEYATALYHQLAELTRHGYVQVAAHTFFLLRAFIGMSGTLSRLMPRNARPHDRTIPLSEEHVAAGEQMRVELEQEGYLRGR